MKKTARPRFGLCIGSIHKPDGFLGAAQSPKRNTLGSSIKPRAAPMDSHAPVVIH